MHTISNQYLEISVKDFGAELCSLKSLSNGKEYLWQGDKKIWGKQAPILFPVIGCMKEGQYSYQNQVYNMTKHGFARDMNFDVSETSSQSLTYTLVSNDCSRKLYPFEFELSVEYQLQDQGLKVSYRVKNLDSKTIYFSIGAHPAFNCDMAQGHCYLEFEKEENLKTQLVNLENGLITQEWDNISTEAGRLKLSYDLFARDALVFEHLESKALSIVDDHTGDRLTMTFDGFPYLGNWSPPGPFVCIEPWYGIADYETTHGKIEEKIGIQTLAVNGVFECSYFIKIKENDKRELSKR